MAPQDQETIDKFKQLQWHPLFKGAILLLQSSVLAHLFKTVYYITNKKYNNLFYPKYKTGHIKQPKNRTFL